jgi:DNA-binding MarR family transcriptional regulator
MRAFATFSENAARDAGVEPQQHQLLLAIKGLPPGARATIKTVAERLQVQHHSAVELVRRAEAAGLIEKRSNPLDHREVLLTVSRRGARLLERLSRLHRAELRTAAADLIRALRTLSAPARKGSIHAAA